MSKQYLCIQRSRPGRHEPPSAAQMEQMYAVFNTWREKFAANIVSLGGRLGGGKIVTADSTSDVDGPMVETKELIGGFMIIQAADVEEALRVARECPGVVMPGSSVEVREIMMP